MRIIGITGTLGAGKGTIVEYLVKRHGFKHFSARAFISRSVEEKNLPINRDTLTDTANELRKQHGVAFIIKSLYKEAVRDGSSAVIESIRSPGEIVELKGQPDFYLMAVDANPRIRYERITRRGSETDNISFEKFLEDEAREMYSDDPYHQNISGVMSYADYTFLNIETPEELFKAVDAALEDIKTKSA